MNKYWVKMILAVLVVKLSHGLTNWVLIKYDFFSLFQLGNKTVVISVGTSLIILSLMLILFLSKSYDASATARKLLIILALMLTGMLFFGGAEMISYKLKT